MQPDNQSRSPNSYGEGAHAKQPLVDPTHPDYFYAPYTPAQPVEPTNARPIDMSVDGFSQAIPAPQPVREAGATQPASSAVANSANLGNRWQPMSSDLGARRANPFALHQVEQLAAEPQLPQPLSVQNPQAEVYPGTGPNQTGLGAADTASQVGQIQQNLSLDGMSYAPAPTGVEATTAPTELGTPQPAEASPKQGTHERGPSEAESGARNGSRGGAPSADNPNLEVLAELKHERDELRDAHLRQRRQPKKILINLLMFIVAILALGAVLYFVVIPKTKPAEQPQQVGFVVPADIDSKPEDEQVALRILSLARLDEGGKIYDDFLSERTKQSTDKNEFVALITQFASTADGPNTNLTSRETGKTTFGASGVAEMEASSQVYSFAYFDHSNTIFIKLNIFKDPEAGGAWRIFSVEFKSDSGDGQAPLTASLSLSPAEVNNSESGGASEGDGQPATDPNDENSL